MYEFRKAKTFLRSEDGAVTVDWVVLTAALVGLGLATMTVVRGGVTAQTDEIDAQLESDGIIRTSFSSLGTPTVLSQADVTALQSTARGLSNAELQTEYTNASGAVNGNFAGWQSGVQDGSYTLNGANYEDGGGNVVVSEADYNASLGASETASVYNDEASQRGVTLN